MTVSHIYAVHGIVLKRRNVGEADRIITLFTKEQGKIRVIAKGVRRIPSKRAPHLEVFRRVGIIVHKGRTLDTVTDAQSSALFDADTFDMQKVSFAYYICELVDRLLPERQEHEDVFRLMINTFRSLDAGDTILAWQESIVTFALELLWILGYLPRATRLSEEKIQPYIERIIERKLRTPKLINQLGC